LKQLNKIYIRRIHPNEIPADLRKLFPADIANFHEVMCGNHRVIVDFTWWYVLFVFVYELISCSAALSYPAFVFKSHVATGPTSFRLMSKEEWTLLADFDNEMQDNKHLKTSLFSILSVCMAV